MNAKPNNQPASLGFDYALDDMDLSEWTPTVPRNDDAQKVHRKKRTEEKAAVTAAAEKAGFTSREPKKARIPQGQINIKADEAIIDEFRDLYQNQEPKWPQGYAFKRAVAALKRELETRE